MRCNISEFRIDSFCLIRNVKDATLYGTSDMWSRALKTMTCISISITWESKLLNYIFPQDS